MNKIWGMFFCFAAILSLVGGIAVVQGNFSTKDDRDLVNIKEDSRIDNNDVVNTEFNSNENETSVTKAIGEQVVVEKEFVAMLTGGSKLDQTNSVSSTEDYIDEDDEVDESAGSVDLSRVYTPINNTNRDGDVRGTDLGYPVWDEGNGRLLLFFGDTVGEWTDATAPTPKKAGHKDWRNNVLMYSTDNDYSDGITVSGYLTNNGFSPTGHAIEVIKGHKNNEKSELWVERSKLPTGAFILDGTIYMSFMSKYKWGFSIDSNNYGGYVKSTDGGVTWTRVNSLSWANHSEGNGSSFGTGRGLDATEIEKLMNENIDRTLTISPDDPNWIDVKKHEGYFFTTTCPVDGLDGYVYLLGEGAFRSTGIKMARVKKENFEIFEEYEYLQGYENGNPLWLSYRDGGLERLNSKDDEIGFILGNNTTGCYPSTCMFNAYLNKWIISTASASLGGIFYVAADNIWGPYDLNNAVMMMAFNDGYLMSRNADGTLNTKLYGGYVNAHLTEDNGRIMYIVVSQFSPIYQVSLVKIVLGDKESNVVKHIIPVEEVGFLGDLDENLLLTIGEKKYYCFHKTDSLCSYRVVNNSTLFVDEKVNLRGFLPMYKIDNSYIVYRRKIIINVLDSVVKVYDKDTEIENNDIAKIGFKRNPDTGIEGLKSGSEFVTDENILYNTRYNYVYFTCAEGYTLGEVRVYKAGRLVTAKIYQKDDTTWYFKAGTTVYNYRFEVDFQKV